MDFDKARDQMVKNQLKPNSIKNSEILNLFFNVPKEDFLPDDMKNLSYLDNEIYLNSSKIYFSNLHIAKMLQSANINKMEKVLHIGGLSGYVTMLLSKISKQVIVVEEDSKLFEILIKNIKLNNLPNVKSIKNDYINGYKEMSPYDVIFIDRIINEVPNNLLDQLSTNNGRIITVERFNSNVSKGIKVTKNIENLYKEYLFDSLLESNDYNNDNKFKF